MNADPYNLDQTWFSDVLHVIQNRPLAHDLPEKPIHPLRGNTTIAAVCDHVQQVRQQLWTTRHPNGEMVEDPYFMSEEGLILWPEVVAKIIIDYIREHPEIIAARLLT